MAAPRNFKNGPLSPMGRATGPLSPSQGATDLFCKKNYKSVIGQRGAGAGGGGRPPTGDRVPPLYKLPTPILSSFEPKNSTKNPEEKERGEDKGSGKALPDCVLVICS